MNLNGISGGTANAYVLQMTYDPTTMAGGGTAAVSGGFLYLGSRNANTGAWQNAIAGNDTTGANATTNHQASARVPVRQLCILYLRCRFRLLLGQMLGSWGVDTTDHTVWAVVDHDASSLPFLSRAPSPCLSAAWRPLALPIAAARPLRPRQKD